MPPKMSPPTLVTTHDSSSATWRVTMQPVTISPLPRGPLHLPILRFARAQNSFTRDFLQPNPSCCPDRSQTRERERFAREGERKRLRTKERARFSENLIDSSEENRLLLGWVAICFTNQEEDIPSVVATTTSKPFAAVVDHSWHIKYLLMIPQSHLVKYFELEMFLTYV